MERDMGTIDRDWDDMGRTLRGWVEEMGDLPKAADLWEEVAKMLERPVVVGSTLNSLEEGDY
jgi:hypothetical protein